ncbi:NAD(FAD)-dependent dehydrogenase [candidate division KSB3 bacterium]|uniref:NAD(FAD)-dependent dehydrogenase n=1 Tax=candidate division KSB3 bacterium TaxID=2044937 RepID=A0A2G6K7X7_9BACT|nr:MAG: NAD(FAD)-dependent dehydrogenase [candidate division KSB3 bacterium]
MEYSDVIVAKVSDIQAGEMKQISVEGGEILLVKTSNGTISALGAHCTHYDAELANGVLVEDTIVCPWHQACFCAKTGDLKHPPALDSLPSYEVEIRGEDIVVKLPEKLKRRRVSEKVSYDPERDSRTFVILGAGAAGNAAAQTLREDGFRGRIVMISREKCLPYDRPNLDKEYLVGNAPETWLPLRSEKFYQNRDIELQLGKTVIAVDIASKTLTFLDNETLPYDKLLLATGGTPRLLDIPGSELPNIYPIRTQEDAKAVNQACEGASRAAIIGASFIGLESAFSLRQRGLDVTVIAPEEVPFESTFGKEIGAMLQQMHEENGITFALGSGVEQFEGKHRVEAVILAHGTRVEADIVILGIGVNPNVGYLQGIELQPDRSVKIDETFHVTDDVYAAGDIARFPDWRSSDGIRIEHWRTAEQHGRDAAHNMVGKNVSVSESVPFFWTKQVDVNIRYVGHVKHWDEMIIDGDIASKTFLAFYIKHNQVYAVAGCKRDQEMGVIHELMHLKKMPTPDELRKGPIDFLALIGS